MAWNRPEDLETPENIDTEQQITNPNIDPECNFELKIHKRKTSSLFVDRAAQDKFMEYYTETCNYK